MWIDDYIHAGLNCPNYHRFIAALLFRVDIVRINAKIALRIWIYLTQKRKFYLIIMLFSVFIGMVGSYVVEHRT